MSSETYDLMEADETFFLSEENNPPESVFIAVHEDANKEARFGYAHIVKLLKSIQPLPKISTEISMGIVDGDGEELQTHPDTLVLMLTYPEQTSRGMTVMFTLEEPTVH